MRKRLSLSINTTTTTTTTKKKKDDDDVKPTSPEEEEEVPLSPAARLFHEPNFNCHVISIMGFAKEIDVDVVKAGLEETLVRHPRFSSLLVKGKSGHGKDRWRRTTVTISDHIIIPTLTPSPPQTPDELVEDYISSLSTTAVPLSRPLWDLHILNLPTSTSTSTVVLRAHHSLGDGISLISLLLACMHTAGDPNAVPKMPEARRRKRKEGRRAWRRVEMMWRTVVDVLAFIATSIWWKDTETVLKGTEGVETRRKRFLRRSLSLEDVRMVKDALGCTVNDVLIGITSFALSRYLNRKQSETNTKNTLRKDIRLRSTLLVNIRPNSGIHDLAEMMEGRGRAKWGNKIGYAILRFPIVMLDDPLEYVRKGREIAEKKKNSLEAIFTYASGVSIVKLFGIKRAAALCHKMLCNTTVSFSNIVGPVEQIAFYGHPMVYIAPSVYGHPQAVTLHFQSYMDKVELVLAVDELTVSDPNVLLDDFVESLRLVKEAAVLKKETLGKEK